MRKDFYLKLAMDGIRKNKRLYAPYILTGAVMVMMFYILGYLTESPTLQSMTGGGVITSILPMGAGVVAFFSLIFLFYTNSFLIRQRYREFGLYNILGMDKRNIGKIMVWESLCVGAAAILYGLVLGIALSKAAELVMMNLLKAEITYDFHFGIKTFGKTAAIYGGIYFLLLLNSLIKVRRSKPLELMKNDKVGEKPPKGNWLFAVLGVIMLTAAYYMAVTIKEPLSALAKFFVAVIMAILATYLLFIAGSVVFCRMLQKNKRYYYKPNHFVSVSSMVYRMKRNGAGLASICILLTIVLVMISATSSLYFGIEDSLASRYPYGVNISVTMSDLKGFSDENMESLRNLVYEKCGEETEIYDWRIGEIPGLITEEGITVDWDSHIDFSLSTYDNVGYLSVVSLEEYNRLTCSNEDLAEDECFLYCIRTNFEGDTFTMEHGEGYKVKKVLDAFIDNGEYNSLIVPTVCMVVKDFEKFVEPVASLKNDFGEPMMMFDWQCGLDMPDTESEIAAADAVKDALRSADIEGMNYIYSYSVESCEANRDSFFQLYGGLFFLGVLLSVVFLIAAVMIIYYKQISEGYEDASRFEIMQKVGMTKKEIRKSINSQMLTVFFLPLVFAGLHLAFAFPIVWELLELFMITNQTLAIIVNIICFVVFGLFYAVIYKITSNAYYAIVSGGKESEC